MFKKIKKKHIILASLLMGIFSLFMFCTIAYSAINSTMRISGNAYTRAKADVRITDFRLNSATDSTSSYEEHSVNTISTKFNLASSYSSIIFDVEVTNYGNLDVGILQLKGTLPSGLSYELIDYKLKDKICDNTGKCNLMAVKTFQIKFTGSPGNYELTQELDFRNYHKVTYTDITNNNYPTEVIDGGNLSITFKESLKNVKVFIGFDQVQSYNSIANGYIMNIQNVYESVEIRREYTAKLVNGTLSEVGSEVCINDQCFYIISNEGSTVTMLAKYNLYVGNIISQNTDIAISNPSGKQNSTAIGWFSGYSNTNPMIGVTAFSNSSGSYSGSIVEGYVNNYRNILETDYGVDVVEARLITKEELINEQTFNCIEDQSCLDNYPWIYGTSYWTQSSRSGAFGDDEVYAVYSDAEFSAYHYGINNNSFGVRPVIEISVDDIEVPPPAKVISGDLDTVGSEICIDTECFYVISSTIDTVTMLAKYNLYVGNSVDSDWNVTPLASPTGKQSELASGWIDGADECYGTTAFSNDISTYEGSIVEGYVNNYETILESEYGVDVVEARLITKDELTSDEIGCSADDYTCTRSSYPWIYSTSYWSGSANSTFYVWSVRSNGLFNYGIYSYDNSFGVRPVIIISRSNF